MFNSKTSSLKMVLFAGMALLAAVITLAVTPAAHADFNGGASSAVGGGAAGGGGSELAPIWRMATRTATGKLAIKEMDLAL